jgi:hypothetical protein
LTGLLDWSASPYIIASNSMRQHEGGVRMGTRRTVKRPFEKVYSSIPSDVKDAIREEADRRGLQISDIIRELLMEKYGDHLALPEFKRRSAGH